MRTRVKISGVKTEEEMALAVEAGADAVGFLVGQIYDSKDFILPSTAARLAPALPPCVSPVIVTHLSDPEVILDVAMQTGITCVELHGRETTVEEIEALRKMLPQSSKIIRAIHFESERDFSNALDLYRLVDAILLDGIDPETGVFCGTGRPFDWSLTKKFAAICSLPVMMAGGLNPANVAEAVRSSEPFAVDALTGLKGADGNLDKVLCNSFVANAFKACEQLKNPDMENNPL